MTVILIGRVDDCEDEVSITLRFLLGDVCGFVAVRGGGRFL